MSCEKNRGAFVSHAAGGGSAAAQAFGGADEAGAALETIFDTARAQAASGSAPQQKIAEAKTRLLFDWMKRDGFKPPTHSTTGLPKADAQFGYAAMYDTLAALRDGKALPALAAQIVETFGQTRALSAIRVDESIARLRCGSCGRFAPSEGSGKPPHFCPNTATPQTFQRALMRRLGVPASAYTTDGLARLLNEARADGVQMRHPITNEPILATLDSLPLAITQGYVPNAWTGEASLALVEVSHGRIAPVLNATGLTMVKPSSGAMEAAAASSGAPIPAGTPTVSATGKVEPLHIITEPADGVPAVSGGSAYDQSRFVGTEFRKKGARGTVIEAGGHTYVVGERSHNPDDWARARKVGLYSPPPASGGFAGIAVGRTLVAAAEIVRTGNVQERGDGVIEVYHDGGLLAVYDPRTRTAGDVAGTPNASAAQIAAVISARALDGRDASRVRGPGKIGTFDEALYLDYVAHQKGDISPLALSDAAYLAISVDIAKNGPIKLGGALTASQCPECGKFMGAAGCRGTHATAVTRTTLADAGERTAEDLPFADEPIPAPVVPRAAPVVPAPETPVAPASVTVNIEAPQVSVASPAVTVEPPQISVASPTVNVEAPQVTVQVDAPQVTLNVDAPQVSVEPPQISVNLDADALARGIAARVPLTVPLAADGTSMPVVPVALPLDERVITVLDRMIDRLDRMDRRAEEAAAPAMTPAAKPARAVKPRADRAVPKAGTMTEQEKVVTASSLRLPRPDRELSALDRKVLTGDFAVLDEDIPAVKTDYAMNATERMVMQRIVSTRAMGVKMGRVNETRSFGIYGPPGTGKNELARQLAATLVTVDAEGNERQGVHMEQVEFDRDMDTGALIGTTALENGSTVARLGPIGLAAVQGSVICLNEVVRNPKALTQFQSMLEEGEIRLKTPEAGIIKIPIHPATTFVLTWNPGLEGDSDRPAEAPRSRIVSFELPAPTPAEQAKRVESFFSKAPSEVKPTTGEVNAAISFFNQIRSSINQGKMQQRGRGSKAVPGPRDLNQFMLAGKTDGWTAALSQMRVFCDQNVEDRDKDWKIIEETFAMNFGHVTPTRVR